MSDAYTLLKNGSTVTGDTWTMLNNLGGGSGIGQVVEELVTIVSDTKLSATISETNITVTVENNTINANVDSDDLTATITDENIKGEINEC